MIKRVQIVDPGFPGTHRPLWINQSDLKPYHKLWTEPQPEKFPAPPSQPWTPPLPRRRSFSDPT